MIAADSALRIALLTYSTKPRGSVVHTLELATALHELGHTVCVFALDKDGSGFERSLPVAYRAIPTEAASSSVDQLIHQRIYEFVDYLSSYSPAYQIYHAQDCISANALMLLRQQGLIPHLVRTVHHVEEYNSPYLYNCQERSIREPDLCLCISQVWQQLLLKRYQLHAPRVYNGVNLARFSSTPSGSEGLLKAQLGLNGRPLYLTVGGIEPRKNSIVLLRAFAQVLSRYPDAQLAIAGGATLFDYQPYREHFFDLAQQLGIVRGRSLILPGVVSDGDLADLYRSADAFVFPSVKEGWGLVVLEAIACGLPVITTNQPPFTEFLTQQQALLVDPHDPGAIAAAMLQVLQPPVAEALVQRSRAVCDRYTWRAAAEAHLTHYRELLTSRPKR